MDDLLDIKGPSVTRSRDGADVLVQCRFAARYRCPSVYLTQWSCGSRVAQSEWTAWPTSGNQADIEFRLPASCFETPVVVRLALLVGPDVRGCRGVWSREFLTAQDLTLEPVSRPHALTA